MHDLSEVQQGLFLVPWDAQVLYDRRGNKTRRSDWDGAIVELGLAAHLGYPGAQELLNKAKADTASRRQGPT